MSQDSPTSTFFDTHLVAALVGVVMGEILSYISFDIRLVAAVIRKRQLRPMPLAYLVARYTMAIGVSIVAWLTLPIALGGVRNSNAEHWLRAIALPLCFTATSAVLGYRALIVHFEHPRLVSRLIHTLLAAEFVGGVAVMTLAVADPTDPKQKFRESIVSVSPAWIAAPLFIAITIDAVFTLIVVVPILRRGERPKKGEVIHMLLSDALFFGIFSIVVKAIAMGFTLTCSARDTSPYLAVRVESVASTIFACRIFRGQETFLRSHRERKADPSLKPIELEEMTPTAARQWVQGDVEKAQSAARGESGAKEARSSLDSVVWKATVTLSDCCPSSAKHADRASERRRGRMWAEQTLREDA